MKKSRTSPKTPKVLVIIPTYNEIENLPNLVKTILELDVKGLEILVVDDNSPDGTGKLADGLAKKHPEVHVLHRKEKSGLGAAYAAGFKWALAHHYDYIVSMDADFSHNPEDIPRLLAEKETAAIVVGSRYIPGGSIVGWDWQRYTNSYGANIVTKLLLGLPVRDATAGFKVYTRKFLQSLNLEEVIATGYAFQVEMLSAAHRQGLAIAEIPITFVDRRVGQSKISGELGRSAKVILQLAARRQGLRQFVKFSIVGLVNTIVDWIIYFFIQRFTPLGGMGQLGKQITKALSFSVAVLSSYAMNRAWTFRSTDAAVAKQAAKFLIVATIGLALNNAIFYLASAPQFLGWPDILALAFSTGAVVFWNFFANKYWTFRPKAESKS